MLKYLTLVVCVALFGLASAPAVAANSERTVIGAQLYQVAAWNDRVCCKRGWQDWFTTRRACDRAGGRQVRNGECRDNWNDKWDTRWFNWGGGDWNKRICCKKGRRDWWSSARECRENGGWEAAPRECRNS
jgi:hypothetical protein